MISVCFECNGSTPRLGYILLSFSEAQSIHVYFEEPIGEILVAGYVLERGGMITKCIVCSQTSWRFSAIHDLELHSDECIKNHYSVICVEINLN